MSDKLKKYDVVIGNPPYSNTLHLTFLLDAISKLKPTGSGIFIHPATWLFNEFSGPAVQSKKLELNNHIKSLDIKPSPFFKKASLSDGVSSTIFTAKHNKDITVNDEINHHNYVVKNLFEISKWGNSTTYKNIKQKILNRCAETGTISTHRIQNTAEYEYFYKLPKKIGNIDSKTSKKKNDFFCFWQKNGYANRIFNKNEITQNEYLLFGFKTKKEAINFQNYTKTYISRFALSIAKNEFTINPVNTLSTTPWLDFTEEWNDKKLAKYFDFTRSELQFIADRIPQYYNDVEPLV